MNRPLIVRKVKMDDSPNREDRLYLLFDQGNINEPLRCLTEIEAISLYRQLEAQLTGIAE